MCGGHRVGDARGHGRAHRIFGGVDLSVRGGWAGVGASDDGQAEHEAGAQQHDKFSHAFWQLGWLEKIGPKGLPPATPRKRTTNSTSIAELRV